MVHVERAEENEAIACFDEALAWHPTFVDARRFKAILLARQGMLADAQEDINRCLQQEPQAGITVYAAACVLARAAEKSPHPEARKQLEDQAIDLLGKAFHYDYGQGGAATDLDLRALHHCPEFAALLKKNPAKPNPSQAPN
jgi:tetratricopeptide (TPR) repeat protein